MIPHLSAGVWVRPRVTGVRPELRKWIGAREGQGKGKKGLLENIVNIVVYRVERIKIK